MSASRAQRGRPKGTGLNDKAHLKAIADLMAADPNLRPTTAIKAAGITEPSAIRRLREKLKDCTDVLSPANSASETIPSRVMALGDSDKTKTISPVRFAETKPVPKSVPAPTPALNADFEAWFAFWCGLGLRNVNTAMELQSAFAKQVLTLPLVGMAMRQHIAANDFTLAACAHSKSDPE